jgi:hypothetical protein
MSHPVLILLHAGHDLLLPARNRILKLRSVVTNSILAT